MAVQVFPFIYTALLTLVYIVYAFCEGPALTIIDYLVYVSPIVVVAHLIYSRMLRLCKWHRVACTLPLLLQAVDAFDAYIYHLEHNAWVITAITIIVTMILFLIAIYKVFFTDNGRVC